MKGNWNLLIRLFKSSFQIILILSLISFTRIDNPASKFQNRYPPTVKIGLLIPDNNSMAAVRGADLAIRRANESGGLNGRPFQLVTRSMDGPWGTGSKLAVELIFEEKVWALLGSHDGRNAHLVEQAATKSTVVFVSAWSGDPTLSQAFVPWFFNCVPNDYQQAAALFKEIYTGEKSDKVLTVSDNTYDSKMALDNFLRIIKTSGKKEPVQYLYDDFSGKKDLLTDQIKKANASSIVLFCQPSASLEIIRQIRQNKINVPLYGSLFLLNENELSDSEIQYFNNKIMIPSENWSESKFISFRREYQRIYKKMPGMVAVYAFDAMSVLIESIKSAAIPDREMIQKSLENINYEGVTGTIQFDNKGNRNGNFKITETMDGVPLILK